MWVPSAVPYVSCQCVGSSMQARLGKLRGNAGTWGGQLGAEAAGLGSVTPDGSVTSSHGQPRYPSRCPKGRAWLDSARRKKQHCPFHRQWGSLVAPDALRLTAPDNVGQARCERWAQAGLARQRFGAARSPPPGGRLGQTGGSEGLLQSAVWSRRIQPRRDGQLVREQCQAKEFDASRLVKRFDVAF